LKKINKGGIVLKPRNDYIVVRRDKPKEVSDGGIALVLAGDADQEPAQGVVLAIGPKVTDVKVGDRLLIGHFGGVTVQVDGEDLVLLREKKHDRGPCQESPLAVIE